MNAQTKEAVAKIRAACNNRKMDVFELAHAGAVPRAGGYGITAYRSRQIVEGMIKAGELTVHYCDQTHIRRFTVNHKVPAGTYVAGLEAQRKG